MADSPRWAGAGSRALAQQIVAYACGNGLALRRRGGVLERVAPAGRLPGAHSMGPHLLRRASGPQGGAGGLLDPAALREQVLRRL